MASRVVLSMIVGNEEHVIERCLRAALPHVDGFVISSNGRDRTKEIALGMQELAPGIVVDEPWRSFGQNRTGAFRAARRWARERRWDLSQTYVITVDADMALRVSDVDYRERLSEPSYTLRQHQGASHHDNVRLMRLDRDWLCARRTHEFWSPWPEVPWAPPLNGVDVDDRNDGGEHARKYERDVELLMLDFDELHDDRSAFYLGETYHHWAQQAEEQSREAEKREQKIEARVKRATAIARFKLARTWYDARIEIGGWNEETFMAKYKRALAVLSSDRLGMRDPSGSSGMELLLESVSERPERAEVWAELSRRFRDASQSHLALLFAERARATPKTNDMLFVDESAWTTKPDEDIAVSGFYTGDHEKGLAACDRLSADPCIDQAWVSKTVGFYIPEKVVAKDRGSFSIDSKLSEGDRYAPSTPCIVRLGGDEIVNVRLVNYAQQRGRWYVPRDGDGAIRTENVVRFGDVQERQSYERPDGWSEHPRIKGLEDQRWIVHDGRIWFTATTYEAPTCRDSPQVVLGRIDKEALATKVDKLLALRWKGATAVEKNWLPWSFHSELRLIYSYNPFVVLGVNEVTGECWEAIRRAGPPCAQRWRGSAAPIPRNGKHLLLVHEVVHHDNHNVYFHRFVVVTGAGIERWSRPFTFDHHGIEYAGGLLARKKEIVVTYSREDKEACWITFTPEQVERMLDAPDRSRR